ncbi:MmcQ/YjbR family DNA-binding protein [bacterium]|nr:MmcQ/YjbR family DNA-binding protein [bacterium]MBU1635415.1 MmcQ/YjbR family DNA-binding protein [bacterium]MBU1874399.1 MmcQ/YjbR family DNA-binding protein [bacterium]
MDLEQLRKFCLSKPGAVETFPFDPVTLVLKVGGKMFALISLDESPLRINLKADPNDNEILRQQFPAIIPGYHMNKRHWNTVILDSSLPDELILDQIDISYGIVFASLPRKIRDAINQQ